MASDPAEVAALDVRYDAAMLNAVVNGTDVIAADFEREVATKSRVVISRDSSEVYRLACGDDQLYTTYYKMVQEGSRLPTDSKADSVRGRVDAMMFPGYFDEVRFGALSLDEVGLVNYGDCHMILKTNMVEFRTTVFTENTIAFADNPSMPAGHRATWASRGRLVIVKLGSALTTVTTASELPAILKTDGATKDGDLFVEAHVYGSISMRTVEQVSIKRTATPAVRMNALKEKLKKLGVPIVMV